MLILYNKHENAREECWNVWEISFDNVGIVTAGVPIPV
jgi:hypothetical protein